MILKGFSATDFRNIESCNIEFLPGVNLLHGRNAQGKTNAIEGIYMFARGRSFRAREDSELVRFGSQGFRISIKYEDKTGTQTLEYALFGKDRLRRKNGYKLSKVTEMVGNFKSVLFYPDDLGLVKDGPEGRRSFINIAAAQCYPTYMKHYADYKKALDNRNCILKLIQKGMPADRNELFSWSEMMAEYASYIYCLREDYIKRLSFYAKMVMKDISSGKEEIEIRYKSDIKETSGRKTDRNEVKEEYKRVFLSDIESECAAGITLHGPHRDDMVITLNGKDSRYFASQGQQRSVVLALKLAEGEVIREVTGEYPVYLFDDVLSELDEVRRRYVLEGAGEKQIIITSCDPDELLGYTTNEIDVRDGKYVLSQ